MAKNIKRRYFVGLMGVSLASVALAGCSTKGSTSGGSKDKTIKIGWIPWDEDVAVTYLWKRILEDEGYTVELTQADAAPVFDGVANGDLDLFFDAWLPSTHEDYWVEYGDTIEDIAVWYDNALLTWAVPEYVEINSIGDLVGRENEFNGRIIGIEPGAGLTRISRESVIPGYGLDAYELVEGSTAAMLAELERAIQDEEPIVVTLWRPHWAYGNYQIKDLADPKGLLGEPEEIHVIARDGFSADHPEIIDWISRFSMDDEQLAALEKIVISEYGTGKELDAIDAWLSVSENRALVDVWLGK